MEEYTLVNRKAVTNNKLIKKIQKESFKRYRRIKGHFPKAKLGKLVKLQAENCYLDFTDNNYPEQKITGNDRNTILNEIKRQDIKGLSGSGFPTSKKLQAVIDATVNNKYLIVNGVECDPGLLHDKWLLDNRYNEIEKGIELLTRCIPFHKAILATKEELTCGNTCYETYTVPNRYPIGAERILIQEVTGISLNEGELPTNRGILVLNIQTVFTIYEAIYLKRPADSRFITVADLSTGAAVVARVKLNFGITDTVSRISKSAGKSPVYYGGGLMSGKLAGANDSVTVKTNFIGYGKEAGIFPNDPCHKCGACARKCPMAIKVNKIVQKLEKNDRSIIKEFNPQWCIKCGTCSYYCPAGKNTMELVNSCV